MLHFSLRLTPLRGGGGGEEERGKKKKTKRREKSGGGGGGCQGLSAQTNTHLAEEVGGEVE